MALDYFYDGQIKRYMQQIMRVFSNFQIYTGRNSAGLEQYQTVPCVYGESDRMVQHIKRKNSENTISTVPFIAVHDNDIVPDPNRRQSPNFESHLKIHEQKYDDEKMGYTGESGHKYTVTRLMPVPYLMTVSVDICYNSTEHKMQICEQIMTLFNDDLDIQTSTNIADWTNLTTMKMTSVNWNTRGTPVGVDDGLRTTNFIFEVPIFINPPVKVKRQKVIEQIVEDIYTSSDLVDIRRDISETYQNMEAVSPDILGKIFSSSNFAGRVVITPENHHIFVQDGEITLLGPDDSETDSNGNLWSWDKLLSQYGEMSDGYSLIQLRPSTDIEDNRFDYIGRIYLTDKPNVLKWSADLQTLPVPSMSNINAVINPTRTSVSNGLPVPSKGDRYIITTEIGNSEDWGAIEASENDIIEYDGANWFVAFDASTSSGSDITRNSKSGDLLKFNDVSKEWYLIPDGYWKEGFWRISL